jgi:hypothetical protein
MAREALPLSDDELVARARAAAPSTTDDVPTTRDGRRPDSKEALLAWLAEVESIAAGRSVDFDDD